MISLNYCRLSEFSKLKGLVVLLSRILFHVLTLHAVSMPVSGVELFYSSANNM